jgi:hypothetical protein
MHEPFFFTLIQPINNYQVDSIKHLAKTLPNDTWKLKKNDMLEDICDAFPSPGVNPLEGSLMWSCGIGTRKGVPDFQHYKGVEGRARSPGIKLERRTSRSSLILHPKQITKWLVYIREHPWVLGKSHGHFGPQDTPRPGLGGSHHLPPYSILCATFRGLHPNGSFSRDSQVGVPKLSRKCPGWSPGTLGAHNSRLQSLIATRSKPNL